MFNRKLFSVLGLTAAVVAAAGFIAQDDKAKDAKVAKIGEKAPDFTLTNLDGKEVKLSDYAGKIVVLQWVNPDCPVCKAAHEDGRVADMVKSFKSMEVVHLAINTTFNTTAEANKAALKAYGVEYPVLLDTPGTVGKLYGAKTTPHLYVIDTEGVLRYNGAIDNKQVAKDGPYINYAVQAVTQIKAGETVSPDTSKPYGCSVKYAKAK